MPTPSTKDRILDAAEKLIAEKGYDGTSLRAITREAGVNLAAIHYHFGGKLPLFKEMFERRVGGINQERLRLLEEAERQAGDHPPSIEALLEALLAPALRLSAQGDLGLVRFMQIAGRMNSATGEHVQALREVFREVHERFVPACQRALPELGIEDLHWRMHFVIGALCTYMADPRRIGIAADGLVQSEDSEEALRQLVAFAAGALRAEALPRRAGEQGGVQR